MLVASGTSVPAETAAMPSIEGVGSSRYSMIPFSRAATDSEVDGVHAPLGSSRSGRSGKASRNASIASHSSEGGKTPPLSLSDPKPQPSTIVRACSTSWAGFSASPHESSGRPG